MFKKGSKDWDKFWSKVKRGPNCWEWQAGCSGYGYGQLRIKGTVLYTHRISWEMGHGIIPKNMSICHTCDNPCCVRPSHLFLGTQKDNSMDAMRKGRMARGEKSAAATLKEVDIKQIRMSKDKVKEVANQYHICPSTVSKIRLRKRWKHVPEETDDAT